MDCLIESQFILDIYNKLMNGSLEDICNFWNSIEAKGTPIIEEIPGDKNRIRVIFLFKAMDAEKIEIFTTFSGFNGASNRMNRIPDTDIWYRTYEVRKGTSFVYGFLVNDWMEDGVEEKLKRIAPDQFNTNKFIFTKDEESPDSEELIMSLMENYDDEIKKLTNINSGVPSGKVNLQRIKSLVYGCSRRVWVYIPESCYNCTEPLDLLVLTDGYTYLYDVKANVIFDNMIYNNLIPPTVVLFIDNQNRLEELSCCNKFADFIASEVVPWVRDVYNVSKNPDKVTIAGSSLGGLTASYLGYCHPEIFGKILSQSGSYWWGPENQEQWLIEKFKSSELLPLKVYLDIGDCENVSYGNRSSMVEVNEKMRDVLISKGYSVIFNKFPGGHDYVCWKKTLIDGLIALSS